MQSQADSTAVLLFTTGEDTNPVPPPSKSLTVIVPALNEESNLPLALDGLIGVLGRDGVDWEIIVVNDGSTDKTGAIANTFAKSEPRIHVLEHSKPAGIGTCFLDGIRASSKAAITWFPGDAENEPEELLRYLPLLDQVDIIVPYVTNREVRSRQRRFVSKLYLHVVNLLFGTTFSYTTGNVIYRRQVLDAVRPVATGFTYQTECLVRGARAGFTFAEVPVRLGKRMHGRSKILTLGSVLSAAYDLGRLFVRVRVLRADKIVAMSA